MGLIDCDCVVQAIYILVVLESTVQYRPGFCIRQSQLRSGSLTLGRQSGPGHFFHLSDPCCCPHVAVKEIKCGPA